MICLHATYLLVCLGFFPSLSKMETCMKGCKFWSLLGLMGIVRILSRVPHLLHLPPSIHSYIWSSSRNRDTQICCQTFNSTTVSTCFNDLVCRGQDSHTQPSAREANAWNNWQHQRLGLKLMSTCEIIMSPNANIIMLHVNIIMLHLEKKISCMLGTAEVFFIPAVCLWFYG